MSVGVLNSQTNATDTLRSHTHTHTHAHVHRYTHTHAQVILDAAQSPSSELNAQSARALRNLSVNPDNQAQLHELGAVQILRSGVRFAYMCGCVHVCAARVDMRLCTSQR